MINDLRKQAATKKSTHTKRKKCLKHCEQLVRLKAGNVQRQQPTAMWLRLSVCLALQAA